MTTADSRPRRPAAETRELVLTVAQELFYWRGIRATGIDTIAAEARVAPTTLYRLFESKDDLVAAYVHRAATRYQQWFTAAAEAGGPHPRTRILAIFDALVEQVHPDRCRGCPFLMALSEIPDSTMPAHHHAVGLKVWVRDQLGQLTRQLAATSALEDPDLLADDLALVMEGVYARAEAIEGTAPAQRARAIAEALVSAATD